MRALVYQGPGQKAWEDVPDPQVIDPGHVFEVVGVRDRRHQMHRQLVEQMRGDGDAVDIGMLGDPLDLC